VQRRALRVLYSCIATIGTMDRELADATRAVILPLLPPWFERFVALLSRPTTAEDPADWGIKLEVLKILVIAISCFGKHIAGMVPAVMAPCWGMLVNCFPVYESTVIAEDGDIDGGELDSDGENLDFETLISQLFELLLTLIGNHRYKELIAGSVGQLAYYSLGYMQMTRDQAATWARDPNQYVADEEDDAFSVRVSGEMLLEELWQQFDADTGTALSEATQRRLQDAENAKAAGNPGWWRIREAALLAVGSMGENLQEMAEDGQLTFDVAGFMENVLACDLSSNCDCAFLVGRALWVSSRLFAFVPVEKRPFFMQAGVAGLGLSNPAPVRIGACRAVAQFCPHVGAGGLGDMATPLYQGLGTLLQNSEEEVLHLVLETLLAVVKADAAAAATWEPSLSEAVFKVWGDYANDPLIAMDAFDVLAALVAVPACQRPLLGRLLPHLCHIISSGTVAPASQPSALVEGALDLLVLLLKRVPAELAASAHQLAWAPLMALMAASGDAGQLQSGTDILRLFVRAGGEGMLSWNGADPDASLQAILQVLSRLLKPESGDSAQLYVGPLIAQLLVSMPGRVGGMLPALLQAIVEKLPHTNSSPVITGLLMVFCRLIHSNTTELLDFLANRPSPVAAAQEGDSALGYIVRLWIERAVEIQGQLNIKLSTTALALLLTSGHPALGGVAVKGRRLDTGGAIRTRSRAKAQAEQWSTVALPVKLVEVLSDALIEAQEQTANGGGAADAGDFADEDDDEDDDWDAGFSGKGLGMDLFEFMSNRAEEEHVVDDEEAKADPVYSVDLPAFIAEKLKATLGANPGFKDAAWQHLTALQQAAVHHALTAA